MVSYGRGRRVLDLGGSSEQIHQWVTRSTAIPVEVWPPIGQAMPTEADDMKLPFDDGSFDLIYSMWTFAHLGRDLSNSALVAQRFLDECARVLRPEGHALIHAANARSLAGLWNRAGAILTPAPIRSHLPTITALGPSAAPEESLSRMRRVEVAEERGGTAEVDVKIGLKTDAAADAGMDGESSGLLELVVEASGASQPSLDAQNPVDSSAQVVRWDTLPEFLKMLPPELELVEGHALSVVTMSGRLLKVPILGDAVRNWAFSFRDSRSLRQLAADILAVLRRGPNPDVVNLRNTSSFRT